MNSKSVTHTIKSRIKSLLQPHGFRQRGNNWYALRNDTLLLIQLQKSVDNTRNRQALTVNLGVYSQTLAGIMGDTAGCSTATDCHWYLRLGRVLPEPSDEWWEVISDEDAALIGDDIAQALEAYGLPALEQVSSTDRLIELWQQGRSPGVTALQRAKYLAALHEH